MYSPVSKRIFHLFTLFVLLVSALGSTMFVTPVYASAVIVTKIADTNDGVCDIDCSLREAIATAGVGDTITFDSGLSGATIRLNSTLTLFQNVTIDGAALAAKITISGDSNNDGTGDVRVFDVNSSVTVLLKSLVITKGWADGPTFADQVGGGINNHGSLMVTDSLLTENFASDSGGAIYNDNMATVDTTTLARNAANGGGAIASISTLTVQYSRFVNNVAGDEGGGAIANADTLTVIHTAFSDNTASGSSGGGIFHVSGSATVANSTFSGGSSAYGAGIGTHSGSTLTVTNSTFSDNVASIMGGGIYDSDTLTIINSTLSGNSADAVGGIFSAGTLHYANTIIANSSGGDCGSSGSIGNNINNLVEDGSCFAVLNGDPGLYTLDDNGGLTQTFALLPDSQAIDNGDDATCNAAPVNTLDQRGSPRPVDGDGDTTPTCDIGAYEFAPVFLVTTNTDPGDGTCDATCSLRDAVDAANANPDVDAIHFDGNYTITLASALPNNTDEMTIDGKGHNVVIDGADTHRILETDANLHLKNLTIQNGNSANGGALLLQDTTTIANVTFASNESNGGGAIFNMTDLNIKNSTFTGNSAPSGSGGAIRNEGGTLTITNSTFDSNNATGGLGGALMNSAGTITLTNSTFSGNAAAGGGGSLYNYLGTLNYANTIIANSSSGGDCVNDGGTIGTNRNNLTEDGSCSASLSGDPGLAPALANNGGATQTVALLTGSTAIDAGNNTICDLSPVSSLDQRGFARPNGTRCDIGAYEYNHPPVVSSIFRNSGSPTNAASVNYSVIFSEPVTNVDLGDFTMTTFDLTGASITSLNGEGASYTVSANTGSGTGTLTLEVLDNNSIIDNLGASLGGPGATDGDFEGETYVIDKTAPSVLEIVRASTNPTGAASVDFEIIFPETVTGVDENDFSLSTTGVTGAAITGVTGSGNNRIVSVNTGSGSGTIYLNLLDNDTVLDQASNPLGGTGVGNGDYTSGEIFTVDKPSVISIIRATTNPSAKPSVTFTVTFSENVTGVDNSDFSLTTTGVTGSSITSVSGSGATRTVTVNTGSGNGTIRVNLIDNDSIVDTISMKLGGTGMGNGNFTTGQSYTINKTLTSTSNAAQDGWVLESSETSNTGGSISSAGLAFVLGDNVAKQQYRGVLSFNTGSLPDTAVITGVILKLKKHSITGGGNPVTMFQGFMVDIKNGFFGTAALQITDFQTAGAGPYGPFLPVPVSNVYSIDLTSGKAQINKLATNSGLTQIRLRFKLDDNNNAVANYLSLYSGNATLVADRPQLVITYYVP